MNVGRKVMDVIIKGGLIKCECQRCGNSEGNLFVWSSGVEEQIEGAVADGANPWIPASQLPDRDAWVLAASDGAVRCVAWINTDKRWADWDKTGIGEVEWWMPIPKTPDPGR